MAIRPVKGTPGVFISTTTGKKFKIVDWREDDKYDTIELQTSTTSTTNGTTHNFFRDLSNKETCDTNLTTPRRIEAGEEMIIDRIGLHVPLANGNSMCHPQDIKKIAENGYFLFKINKFIVAEGPMIKFGSGYGLAGNTVENASGVCTIGVASTAAAAKLLREQFINEGHDLFAQLKFEDRNTWTTSTLAAPSLTNYALVKAFVHGLIRAAATKG